MDQDLDLVYDNLLSPTSYTYRSKQEGDCTKAVFLAYELDRMGQLKRLVELAHNDFQTFLELAYLESAADHQDQRILGLVFETIYDLVKTYYEMCEIMGRD